MVRTAATVDDVPRYSKPYADDPFIAACASLLLRQGIEPDLAMADYLSFVYDEETGHIGINYVYEISAQIETWLQQLNESLPSVRFHAPLPSRGAEEVKAQPAGEMRDHRVQLRLFTEESGEEAHESLTRMIDRGIPILAILDAFETSYHPVYGKGHQAHGVVIAGYDEGKDEYRLLDRFMPYGVDFDGPVPGAEIRRARQSRTPSYHAAVGHFDRPIRYLWGVVQVPPAFRLGPEQVHALLRESCRRMLDETSANGQPCGLARLEAFRLRLRSLTGEAFQYLLEHQIEYYTGVFKRISRGRLRFKAMLEASAAWLPAEDIRETAAGLEESAKRWRIASNMMLKLGFIKMPALLQELDHHLGLAAEAEQAVALRLSRLVHSGVDG